MKHCLVVTEFEKNYEYCNYFIGPTRGLSNSKEQEKKPNRTTHICKLCFTLTADKAFITSIIKLGICMPV